MGETMGINDLGSTATPLTAPVAVEPTERGDVQIRMTAVQADKLRELLGTCVDDEMVRYDWAEPESADFVRALVQTLGAELHP